MNNDIACTERSTSYKALSQQSSYLTESLASAEQLFRRWAVPQYAASGAIWFSMLFCKTKKHCKPLNIRFALEKLISAVWKCARVKSTVIAAAWGLLTDRKTDTGTRHRLWSPLAHLLSDWHIFTQRLLRQSRVKSDLHHAGVETSGRVSCAGWKIKGTVGAGLQAPRCVTHFETSDLIALPVAGGD